MALARRCVQLERAALFFDVIGVRARPEAPSFVHAPGSARTMASRTPLPSYDQSAISATSRRPSGSPRIRR